MSVTFLDKEFDPQMKNRILPLMRIHLEEGYFKAADGAKIHYGYINNPKAIYKDKSPIHYGMCVLDIKDKNHLVGQYFTDRGTRGDIELQNILEKDNTIQKQLVNSKK